MSLRDEVFHLYPFLSNRTRHGLERYLAAQGINPDEPAVDLAATIKAITDQDFLAIRGLGKGCLDEFRRCCPRPQAEADRERVIEQAADLIEQGLRLVSAAELFSLNNRMIRRDLGIRIESL